nr:multidrug efflux system protein MdtO [Klebsiella pneumoniae]
MTSQSEILVRLLLWLWVAINTAILVTLLVNACFQQAFPGNQFKARLAGMLHEVARRLAAPDAEAPPTFSETAAQFNQLQSLFARASRATPEIAADPGLALAAGRHFALLPAGGPAASRRGG